MRYFCQQLFQFTVINNNNSEINQFSSNNVYKYIIKRT